MTELRALAAHRASRASSGRQGFLPMANAAVKGSFADRRAYMAGASRWTPRITWASTWPA